MTSSLFLRQRVHHVIFHDGYWKRDHDFLAAFHSILYQRCMESEITTFFCQPYISWSVFRHDGFWKSNHDFMIVFHCNFLSKMHDFRNNKVFLKTGYDVIVIYPPGALHAICHDEFWKNDHHFLVVIHSIFISAKHGIQYNEVLLPTGYDVMVSLPPGALHALFHDGFWKSDPDFLIAFYNNFLLFMHGFRDSEVLLPTSYDVIVIYPLGGFSGDITWRILKERSWLPDSVP